jgi:Zn-finger nucleic acid-binding protein
VPEEPVLTFACPRCKRKLRFRQRQAGHRGACPRCKGDFTFPLSGG